MPDLDWTDATMIPAFISRIKTEESGGWAFVVKVPEIAKEQVRQLVGTENKVLYTLGFLRLEEIEKPEKRRPGRPAKNE